MIRELDGRTDTAHSSFNRPEYGTKCLGRQILASSNACWVVCVMFCETIANFNFQRLISVFLSGSLLNYNIKKKTAPTQKTTLKLTYVLFMSLNLHSLPPSAPPKSSFFPFHRWHSVRARAKLWAFFRLHFAMFCNILTPRLGFKRVPIELIKESHAIVRVWTVSRWAW